MGAEAQGSGALDDGARDGGGAAPDPLGRLVGRVSAVEAALDRLDVAVSRLELAAGRQAARRAPPGTPPEGPDDPPGPRGR